MFASSLGGLGISFAGFGFPALISATSFTVVGVSCKIITVVLSQLFLHQRASCRGLACLELCVAGATAYQPAPKRNEGAARELESKS